MMRIAANVMGSVQNFLVYGIVVLYCIFLISCELSSKGMISGAVTMCEKQEGGKVGVIKKDVGAETSK